MSAIEKEKSVPYWCSGEELELWNRDVMAMHDIAPNSVDLIVTSPPYNVEIPYKSNFDGVEYDIYLDWTRTWIAKCFDWLKSDGRFCLNIPLDINKGGQQAVGADITTIAKNVGFKYHSTIVWNEGNISRRTAWGSWLSASAPYVIAPVELIVVLYKDSWKKHKKGQSDIEKQQFMDWTNGVWTFNGESKKRVGHPAPFPIELPRRCIKLFTYVGDTVLDPFCGSGTTLLAALKENRRGIGIELDQSYCDLTIERIAAMHMPLRFDGTTPDEAHA